MDKEKTKEKLKNEIQELADELFIPAFGDRAVMKFFQSNGTSLGLIELKDGTSAEVQLKIECDPDEFIDEDLAEQVDN